MVVEPPQLVTRDAPPDTVRLDPDQIGLVDDLPGDRLVIDRGSLQGADRADPGDYFQAVLYLQKLLCHRTR